MNTDNIEAASLVRLLLAANARLLLKVCLHYAARATRKMTSFFLSFLGRFKNVFGKTPADVASSEAVKELLLEEAARRAQVRRLRRARGRGASLVSVRSSPPSRLALCRRRRRRTTRTRLRTSPSCAGPSTAWPASGGPSRSRPSRVVVRSGKCYQLYIYSFVG